MQADQAIYTSLERRGKSGYHVVARSPGLTEGEVTTLTRWCPSHDGLAVDEANPISVNCYPIPTGRFVLARTCRGRPEYSGRGGWQIYTHALVFDLEALKRCGFRPFRIYRDALALGYLHYRPDPKAMLPRLELPSYHPRRESPGWSADARALGLPIFDSVVSQINSGQEVTVPFAGDRASLAESLLDQVEANVILTLSFATSLHPSSVRPFKLLLVAPAPGTGGAAAPGRRPGKPTATVGLDL